MVHRGPAHAAGFLCEELPEIFKEISDKHQATSSKRQAVKKI